MGGPSREGTNSRKILENRPAVRRLNSCAQYALRKHRLCTGHQGDQKQTDEVLAPRGLWPSEAPEAILTQKRGIEKTRPPRNCFCSLSFASHPACLLRRARKEKPSPCSRSWPLQPGLGSGRRPGICHSAISQAPCLGEGPSYPGDASTRGRGHSGKGKVERCPLPKSLPPAHSARPPQSADPLSTFKYQKDALPNVVS